MRATCLAALLAGGLAATAAAQTTATLQPAPAPRFAGTYHVATGRFTPSTGWTSFGTAGACGEGLIFNQRAVSGFYYDVSGGNTVIDEGVIPDSTAGGPADVYTVQGMLIAYVTQQTTPVACDVTIWEAGAACGDFAALGVPTAQINASGLPSSTTGAIQAFLVRLDLTGGAEFDVAGSDGSTVFNYGLRFPGATAATGPFASGDPLGCAEGAGTFADTGIGCDGAGGGSGLGAADVFFQEADGSGGTGCFFFGGYPANPFASFYMQLDSSVLGDDCDAPRSLGNLVGSVAYDTTCATSSGNGSCASITNDVYFSWSAPNSGDYTFDTCGTSYDTRLGVLSDCATCIAQNDDDCGLQSSVTVLGLTAGDTLLVQVGGFGSGDSGPGVLTVTEFIDPCLGSTDVFEDNDTCHTTTLLTSGTYQGLRIESDDDDYYLINVPDLATLTAEIKFLHANGDTDIFLYENLASCLLDEGPGVHGCANTLDCGFSTSDNESASWTNTTGALVSVKVQVKLWDQGVCNDYDLVLNVNGGNDIGTNYCNANANSSGVPAKMKGFGSASVAANNLALKCLNMPTIAPNNIWNYFAVGTAQNYVVLAVEQGNLCIGGTTARFTGPGQITNAGLTGFAELVVDLNALPNGMGAPLPGDSLYFTNFYRDVNPGPTSNLANGLCITFE
jgi:hypothetical protein